MAKHISQHQVFEIDYSTAFCPQALTMIALVDFDMTSVMEDFIIRESSCFTIDNEISDYLVLNIVLPKETDRQTIIDTHKEAYKNLIHHNFPNYLIKNGYAKEFEFESFKHISDTI